MPMHVNASDPRVKRTRKLLQQAIMDLLQRKSLHSITVQDIAARATVNRVTFYAHFEDKFDLLDSVIRDGVQETLASCMDEAAPFDAQSLGTLCRTVFDFLQKVHTSCKPSDDQFQPFFETAVQQELHAFVLGWLDRVPAREDRPFDHASVAAVISWTIFGTGADWSRGNTAHGQTPEDLARHVVHVLSAGLSGLFTAQVAVG